MNDYKELIDSLQSGEYIVFKAVNTATRQVTKYNEELADVIKQLAKERNQLQSDIWELNDLLEFKDDMIKRLKTKCDTCPHDIRWEKRGFVDYE